MRRVDPEIVEHLLARGARADRLDSEGEGPLHRLGGEHAARIARALIAAGADPRVASGAGVTPLARAEAEGLDDAAAVLRPHTG